MDFENNWVVPVLHDGTMNNSLIDPVLKVEMRVVVPRQELDEVIRLLRLYYDPEFGSDRLTRQSRSDVIANGVLRNRPENPLRLARSERHRKICDLGFDAGFYPQQGDDPEEMLVRLHEKNLRITVSLLSKAAVPVISAYPYPFLYHSIKHCTDMAVWDELAARESMRAIRGAKIRRIRFLVKSTVAEELASFNCSVFENMGNDQCLLAVREVRS